jgi:hypothetical protein
LIAPHTNQVTTGSIVAAGGVTGTPWAAAGYITNAINTTNAAGIASVTDGVISIGTAPVAAASSTPEWTLLTAYTNLALVNSISISNLPAYANYRFKMSGCYTNAAVNYIPYLNVNGISAAIHGVYLYGGWASGYTERRLANSTSLNFGNWLLNGSPMTWDADFVLSNNGTEILIRGHGYLNALATQTITGNIRTNCQISSIVFTHYSTSSANQVSSNNYIRVYGGNL